MSIDNLLKALDDEYKAYSFYFSASEFGAPFTNLLEQLNQGKTLINETAIMVNKLKDGSLGQDELEGFLGKLNYSLVGGAIMGAFSVIIVNELLNKNKE